MMHGNLFTVITPWVLAAGIVLVAALVWFVGSTLSAVGSGWHRLEHRFRAHGEFRGEQRSFQSAAMRGGSRYNRNLTLGANRDGLYLRAMWLARMAHPPLFVTWSEVAATACPRQSREGTLFTLGRKERVPLWVFKSTGDWLRAYMPSTEETIERHDAGQQEEKPK